jgi:hypothetical protein
MAGSRAFACLTPAYCDDTFFAHVGPPAGELEDRPARHFGGLYLVSERAQKRRTPLRFLGLPRDQTNPGHIQDFISGRSYTRMLPWAS